MDPFYRWTGGKRALIDRILPELPGPRPLPGLVSPFLGGAAVELRLLSAGAVAGPVVLGDTNAALVSAWSEARDNPADLLGGLLEHAARDSQDHFVAVRSRKKHSGADFLYLNHAGYGGLWRTNKSGGMNTPRQKPYRAYTREVAERQHARAELVGRLLRKLDVRLVVGDWRETLAMADPRWLLYADPPYLGTFTSYSAGTWDLSQVQALAEHARQRIGPSLIHDGDDSGVRQVHAQAGARVIDLATSYAIGVSRREPKVERMFVYAR